jgi:hypothetical protein
MDPKFFKMRTQRLAKYGPNILQNIGSIFCKSSKLSSKTEGGDMAKYAKYGPNILQNIGSIFCLLCECKCRKHTARVSA